MRVLEESDAFTLWEGQRALHSFLALRYVHEELDLVIRHKQHPSNYAESLDQLARHFELLLLLPLHHAHLLINNIRVVSLDALHLSRAEFRPLVGSTDARGRQLLV